MFFRKDSAVNIRKIDQRFAVSGQIRPADVAELAKAGYGGIICARPDNEDNGQPSFAIIAEEAAKAGIKAAYIPVSGRLTPSQAEQFREAMNGMEGPVLGYCRSGARAGSLYATLGH